MEARHIYEINGGTCYGYFSGAYLYTMDGECTHYRGGDHEKYLYTMNGGKCEYYQEGKYIYTMSGGKCRWYFA